MLVRDQKLKAATEYRVTKYVFPQDQLPEGFESIIAEVKSDKGGYTAEGNKAVGFSYQVYMDDDVMYERSEEIMKEPGGPRDTEDLLAVKHWLDQMEDKYPPMKYEYDLGKLFSDYTTPEGGEVKLTMDLGGEEETQVGTCKIENGVLKVSLDSICYFMEAIQFKFETTADLNNNSLTDKPQDVVFDDDGNLILQSKGTAGGGDNDSDKPVYQVKKEAPSQVTGTTIEYAITVTAENGGYLNGKTIRDIVPKGLKVQSGTVTYTAGGQEHTDDLKGAAEYTFPKAEYEDSDTEKMKITNEILQAEMKLVMTLDTESEQYRNFIKGGLNETFKNKAELYEEEPSKPLAGSEEVSTKMKAQLLSKSGQTYNLEGTQWLWTIKANAQLPILDKGYLLDTLCATDHMYDFEEYGIKVKSEGEGEYTIPGNAIHKISKDQLTAAGITAWENLTVENLRNLIGKAATRHEAYYFYLDESEDSPFDDEQGNGKTDKRQRAVLVLPYNGLEGTTESKKVTIKYVTELNTHGLDEQEYMDAIKDYNEKQPANPYKPSIDNGVTLIWKNHGGQGSGMIPPNIVDITKDPLPHPGSVAKDGVKYNPKTQEVTWDIFVNRIGVDMKEVTLVDTLANTYDLKNVKIQCWKYDTSRSDNNEQNYTPTEVPLEPNDYIIGKNQIEFSFKKISETEFYQLRLTMKLKDGKLFSNPGDQKATNKVAIDYKNNGEPKSDKSYF